MGGAEAGAEVGVQVRRGLQGPWMRRGAGREEGIDRLGGVPRPKRKAKAMRDADAADDDDDDDDDNDGPERPRARAWDEEDGEAEDDGGSRSLGDEDRSEGSSSDEEASRSGSESGEEEEEEEARAGVSGGGGEVAGAWRLASRAAGAWDAGLAGLPARRRWQDRPLPGLEVGLGAFEAAVEVHRRDVAALGGGAGATAEVGDALRGAVVEARRGVDALHKAAWQHAQLLRKADRAGAAVEVRRRALLGVKERRREVDAQLTRLARQDARASAHEACLWRAHWLVGGLELLAHRLADRAAEAHDSRARERGGG